MRCRFYIKYLFVLFLCAKGSGTYAQTTVTHVYSDFSGWWTSSTGAISTTVPNNSHNLLGFRTGSTVYSTGVNDAALTAHGVTFTAQVFESLPVISVGSGGIIGVGASYTIAVVNDPIRYLTDGTNGLDMGTGMFNWSGTNRYTITTFNPSAIGDGIPDLLIPQIGDPSGGATDIFRFENSSNTLVGNQVSVNFGSVSTVANLNWKFYSRATPPVIGAAGAGSRPMRLVAYDFSDLGITTGNYTSVATFVHQLSGSSDQSFVAYNKTSFTILPVSLLSFSAVQKDSKVELLWSTASEQNNNFFTIERSTDALIFNETGKVQSKALNGNSNVLLEYSFTDNQPVGGYNYYRLKQTDIDGQFAYSPICMVNFGNETDNTIIYPNPAKEWLTIAFDLDDTGEINGNDAYITIVNSIGQTVHSSSIRLHPSAIDVSGLVGGVYFIQIEYKGKVISKKLIVR